MKEKGILVPLPPEGLHLVFPTAILSSCPLPRFLAELPLILLGVYPSVRLGKVVPTPLQPQGWLIYVSLSGLSPLDSNELEVCGSPLANEIGE